MTGKRRSLLDIEIFRTDDLIEISRNLSGITCDLGHTLLVMIEFLQNLHRNDDVVLLEAVEAGRVVQEHVGIEDEQFGRLLLIGWLRAYPNRPHRAAVM